MTSSLPHLRPGCQGPWVHLLMLGQLVLRCEGCGARADGSPGAALAAARAMEAVVRLEAGRRFVSASGFIYQVYLTPFEGTAGARQLLNAVVFEGAGGEWIGSVPVYHQVNLESLSDADLEELLERAMGRDS